MARGLIFLTNRLWVLYRIENGLTENKKRKIAINSSEMLIIDRPNLT